MFPYVSNTLPATKFLTASGVTLAENSAGSQGCPAQPPDAPELPIRQPPLALSGCSGKGNTPTLSGLSIQPQPGSHITKGFSTRVQNPRKKLLRYFTSTH